MVEAIAQLVHKDYSAIVDTFVTLEFIPPGTDLKPILPVLAKVRSRGKHQHQRGGNRAWQVAIRYSTWVLAFAVLTINYIGAGDRCLTKRWPEVVQRTSISRYAPVRNLPLPGTACVPQPALLPLLL